MTSSRVPPDEDHEISSDAEKSDPGPELEAQQSAPPVLQYSRRLSKIDSALSTASARYQSTLSRVRSRDPRQNAPFTHPLTHQKTAPDVLVDFDGPDDPYRPINWSFGKKAITTVLYGLTTMGKYFVPPTLCIAFLLTI